MMFGDSGVGHTKQDMESYVLEVYTDGVATRSAGGAQVGQCRC